MGQIDAGTLVEIVERIATAPLTRSLLQDLSDAEGARFSTFMETSTLRHRASGDEIQNSLRGLSELGAVILWPDRDTIRITSGGRTALHLYHSVIVEMAGVAPELRRSALQQELRTFMLKKSTSA